VNDRKNERERGGGGGRYEINISHPQFENKLP